MRFEDETCVHQCLDGHPEEFRALVDRYQNILLTFLSGRMGGVERAEEATQETFVRAYLHLAELRDPKAFFPWLLGIAGRVALEEERKARKASPAAGRDFPASEAGLPGGQDLELRGAGAALPDAIRGAVLLRFYGGLSCREAAERLNLTLGSMTKRLSRAYAMLRDCLNIEVKP